jgi:hypothetical protein
VAIRLFASGRPGWCAGLQALGSTRGWLEGGNVDAVGLVVLLTVITRLT